MQLSQGNLSTRILLNKQDEFGIVSLGFNEMAENLADLYTNLEHKVSEKTAELEQNNHELSSMYEMSAFLRKPNTQDIMTQGFLKHIITISQASAGSIRLLDKINQRLNYVASQGLPDELLSAPECSSLNDCFCGAIARQEKNNKLAINLLSTPSDENYCIKKLFKHLVIFKIKHNDNELGVMMLYYKDSISMLSPQTRHLIEMLTAQLAVAIENQQLILSDKQLAIMEERNLMAQGLHDSIAQSLSFLNLQVQMLKSALTHQESKQTQQHVNFIEQGIQECYDDVRELLLNFRVRLDKKETFEDVIEKLITRFQAQTQIGVHVQRSSYRPYSFCKRHYLMCENMLNAIKLCLKLCMMKTFLCRFQITAVDLIKTRSPAKKTSTLGFRSCLSVRPKFRQLLQLIHISIKVPHLP